MSRHVLLIGFEPFGPHRVNPSELLVRSFEGRTIAGQAIGVRVFPVETRPLRARLEALLREERPGVVLGVGFAPGRAALALERVALNVLDFPIPDTVGTMPKGEPIAADGPDARFATLPLNEIVAGWIALGVAGYVSNSAGTYLCNQWLYEALALTAGAAQPVPTGFVHVPALPTQANEMGPERTPSMSLDLMRRGLESALETIGAWRESLPAPAVAPARPAEAMWIPRG